MKHFCVLQHIEKNAMLFSKSSEFGFSDVLL